MYIHSVAPLAICVTVLMPLSAKSGTWKCFASSSKELPFL